jgi:hypothetical protein
MKRVDSQGYETKVTALGRGFGCRVLKGGKVVAEGRAASKELVTSVLRDLLRTLNKCGSPSEMASASRQRNKAR